MIIKHWIPVREFFRIISPLTFILITGCQIRNSESPDATLLEPVEIIELDVDEPSGLTANTEFSELYIVSDPSFSRIFKLDLDGNILDTLEYVGNDLEGISYDSRDHTLWITEEEFREVVHLDTMGFELGRFQVDFSGEPNQGFEGITLLPDGSFYVVNESKPGAVLKLDSALMITEIFLPELAEDYSGIYYDLTTETTFLLSDLSRNLFLLDEQFQVVDTYRFDQYKNEGICYNINTGELYIVNDQTSRLMKYNVIVN